MFSPGRLMTNAHVVAGVREPEISLDDETIPAEVVLYDSDLDVAVLAFEAPAVAALGFDFAGEPGKGVAILGYPEDGPFDVQAARIRAEQRLRSPNIYGTDTVVREVFSLRGTVRPGNSGGPIVSSAGDVLGVVFAASVTDPATGYALTAEQVRESAAAGHRQRPRRSRPAPAPAEGGTGQDRLNDGGGLLSLVDRPLGSTHLLDLADAEVDRAAPPAAGRPRRRSGTPTAGRGRRRSS